MKFLLDESAELRIATFLTQLGHNVTAISRDYPNTLPDQQVLHIATTEGRILITNDKDFGELIFHQKLPHAGVIFFRLGLSSTAEDKIAAIERLLASHQDRLDQFLVVTPRGVRVGRIG